MTGISLDRRRFLVGGAALSALALAGCSTTTTQRVEPIAPTPPPVPADIRMMYAPVTDEPYFVRGARVEQIDPRYWRQRVADPTGEPAGSVVVDTASRFLYHVENDGMAMRYGVGIGRDGFRWSGRAIVAYKRKWPTWTPPSEMIARQPELEQYRDGMAPGPDNPLGARALYIHEDGRDTLYRLHGNQDESAIGHAVSSGCVRLLQQDVMDLYTRVRDGSPILVA